MDKHQEDASRLRNPHSISTALCDAMAAPFEIGARIVDKKGSRGTVRYVGPVATSKSADAVYVGVEWDDNTRGKHDGAVTTKGDGGGDAPRITSWPGWPMCHCAQGWNIPLWGNPSLRYRGI